MVREEGRLKSRKIMKRIEISKRARQGVLAKKKGREDTGSHGDRSEPTGGVRPRAAISGCLQELRWNRVSDVG